MATSPANTLTKPSRAIGPIARAITVTITVAVDVWLKGSLMVYWNCAEPMKPRTGVNCTVRGES